MTVTYIVTCNGGKAAHLNCQQKSLPDCQCQRLRLFVKIVIVTFRVWILSRPTEVTLNTHLFGGIFRFHLFQWQQIHVVELHGTLIAACIQHFTSEACISDSIPSPCLTKDSPLVTDYLRCQHLDHISLPSVCFKNGACFYLPAAKIASGNYCQRCHRLQYHHRWIKILLSRLKTPPSPYLPQVSKLTFSTII